MLWELCTTSLPVFPLEGHWPPKDNSGNGVKEEVLEMLTTIRERCLVEEKHRSLIGELDNLNP